RSGSGSTGHREHHVGALRDEGLREGAARRRVGERLSELTVAAVPAEKLYLFALLLVVVLDAEPVALHVPGDRPTVVQPAVRRHVAGRRERGGKVATEEGALLGVVRHAPDVLDAATRGVDLEERNLGLLRGNLADG